jgi:threonine/homoserine efflux transporter RhtA
MSVHPVLAEPAGLILLRQRLDLHECQGMSVGVTANALAVRARTATVAQSERPYTFRERSTLI